MNQTRSVTDVVRPGVVLPGWEIRALSIQAILLFAAAFLLPAAAHRAGLPVRLLLPMHWPVILVGLCYGWRSGALTGMAAPGLSYVLSGWPLPGILPAMTVELAAYGLLAGFFRETLRWNPFNSAALAVVGGRAVFVGMALATGAMVPDPSTYLRAALLPGLVGGLAQVLVLPLIATWWVRRAQG